MQNNTSVKDGIGCQLVLLGVQHAALLFLLSAFLFFVPPAVLETLGGFGGQLPWYMMQLVFASDWLSHTIITVLVVLVLLAADVAIYRSLLRKKGAKPATVYAIGATGLMTAIFVLYIVLTCMSLDWISAGQRLAH
jgi:type II secretory pathway component PulF